MRFRCRNLLAASCRGLAVPPDTGTLPLYAFSTPDRNICAYVHVLPNAVSCSARPSGGRKTPILHDLTAILLTDPSHRLTSAGHSMFGFELEHLACNIGG